MIIGDSEEGPESSVAASEGVRLTDSVLPEGASVAASEDEDDEAVAVTSAGCAASSG